MSYTEGISGLSALIASKPQQSSVTKKKIGRVYACLLSEANIDPEVFRLVGGWDAIGTIFYLDYERREELSEPQTIELIKSNYFEIARPSEFGTKFYPLVGELVSIEDYPAPVLPGLPNIVLHYYTLTLNYFNNYGYNVDGILPYKDKTISKHSKPFEKDYLLEGRNGSSIRLSSSIPFAQNWWSSGKEGDPIILITNGKLYDTDSLEPHVEDVNTDASSLVLTSTQTVPINASKNSLNPLTQPTALDKYSSSQAVLIANRVALVAKVNDLMLTAANNIEIYTTKQINLDADKTIALNSPQISIGLDTNTIASNPAVLGNELVSLLLTLFEGLATFTTTLSTAITTPVGSPIVSITVASELFFNQIMDMLDSLTPLLSTKVYIAS